MLRHRTRRANGHCRECARHVRAAWGNRQRVGVWAMAPVGMGRRALGVAVSGGASPCRDRVLGRCAPRVRTMLGAGGGRVGPMNNKEINTFAMEECKGTCSIR